MANENDPREVVARLKDVTEALEEIVRDRSLLRDLSLEERTRLLAAAGTGCGRRSRRALR